MKRSFVGRAAVPVLSTSRQRARSGSMRVADVERYLAKLRNGSLQLYDQFMDDHLGMNAVVPGDASAWSFLGRLNGSDAVSAPTEYFWRYAGWDGLDLFFVSPAGITLEVQVTGVSDAVVAVLPHKTWQLCTKEG